MDDEATFCQECNACTHGQLTCPRCGHDLREPSRTEAESQEVIRSAEEWSECDLSDDALIYSGSVTIERWQCHVPIVAISVWPRISRLTRALIFLTAINAMIGAGIRTSRTGKRS